jgi:ABC-type multidrug transport system ATPase subunit
LPFVIKFLKSFVCIQGTTVVCTIHQPSNEVFNYFDNLLLLAEGGRVAFFGSRQKCLNFFAEIGKPCPAHWNPGDHFVHAVAVVPFHEESSRKKLNQICQEFESRSDDLKTKYVSYHNRKMFNNYLIFADLNFHNFEITQLHSLSKTSISKVLKLCSITLN